MSLLSASLSSKLSNLFNNRTNVFSRHPANTPTNCLSLQQGFQEGFRLSYIHSSLACTTTKHQLARSSQVATTNCRYGKRLNPIHLPRDIFNKSYQDKHVVIRKSSQSVASRPPKDNQLVTTASLSARPYALFRENNS
jgi:hypothetical protein